MQRALDTLAAAAVAMAISVGGASAAPAGTGPNMPAPPPAPAPPAAAAPAPRLPAPIVFFDIVGTDLASQAAFYKAVFNWDADPQGRISAQVASPLPGLLRVEPAPAEGSVAERVLYVGVPDINATLATIKANGGLVLFPRTEVPGAVVIALFADPAGNRMGLVEMAGGKPKVPPAR